MRFILAVSFSLLSVTYSWAEDGVEEGGPPRNALPEIVVTASGAEQDPFLLPQNVSAIDEEEIRRRIPTSTPDLLVREPGVLVQKTNWGGGSPFVRGLTGKHVLLLVDGIRLNNSLTRFGPHQYLNTIDPNQAARIEVVRGPMSVLYGSDAMGGVVNVVTKSRDDFDDAVGAGGLVYGKYGSAARERTGRLQVEGNLGRFGFFGGGTYRGFDDLRGGRGVGVQAPTAYEEVDADAKFNMRFGAGHEFTLATQFVRQFDVPKTSEVTLGGKRKFNYEPQMRSLSYFRYEGRDRAGPWLDLARITISYQVQEEGEEVVADDPDVETRERNGADTIGASVHLRTDLGRWSLLSYGAELYYDRIESCREEIDHGAGTAENHRSAFPDGATYRSFGLYIQDGVALTGRLSLLLGGRYSRIDTEGELTDPGTGERHTLSLHTENLSGMAHLRLGLTDFLCVVAGAAQGFRAPNMEDFFGKVDFSAEIPNTDLEPERSINYEVGVKVRCARFSGGLFFFRSDYDDLIDRVNVDFADDNGSGVQDPGEAWIVQRRNIGQARIKGVELDCRVALTDRWSAAGTLSWTQGDNLTDGEPLRRTPPVLASLALRYDAGGCYWAEACCLMASEQDRLSGGDVDDPRIPKGGTPGYAVLNLAGGVSLSDTLTCTLALENLGDRKYKTHGSGIYGPGTNFMIGCRYVF